MTQGSMRAWGVIFCASLFFLFEYINLNSFNALNSLLRDSFHVNALEISNLSAMYFYANVLFLIPAGLLLDRYSTRKLILCGLGVSVIATYVFASTDSLLIAKLCRFITGMASTLCLLSATVLTARWFRAKQAAQVMGFVVAMPMLGGTLAQQTGLLAQWLDSWRMALVFIGTFGVLFWFLIALYVRNYPSDYQTDFWPETGQPSPHFFQSLWKVLRQKQVWLTGIYTQLLCLPVFILGALWGKDYLMTAHHLGSSQSELCSSLIFIGMLVGSPLQGYCSDYLANRRKPMLVGALLTFLTMLIIILTPSLSSQSLYILFFALGFFSSTQILTYAVLIESAPSTLTGTTESVAAVIIMSGGAIFQPLFGYLLESHSSGQLYNGLPIYNAADYTYALWLLPIAFGVSFLMALFIQETHAERQYA